MPSKAKTTAADSTNTPIKTEPGQSPNAGLPKKPRGQPKKGPAQVEDTIHPEITVSTKAPISGKKTQSSHGIEKLRKRSADEVISPEGPPRKRGTLTYQPPLPSPVSPSWAADGDEPPSVIQEVSGRPGDTARDPVFIGDGSEESKSGMTTRSRSQGQPAWSSNFFETELDALREQLRIARKGRDKLHTELERVKKEKNTILEDGANTRQLLHTAWEENERKKADLAASTERIRNLEKKVASHTDAHKKLAKASGDLATATERICNLEQQVTTHVDAYEMLAKANGDLAKNKQCLEAMGKNLALTREESTELKRKVTSLEKGLALSSDVSQNASYLSLKEAFEKLEQEKVSLQNELSNAQAGLSNVQAELTNAQAELKKHAAVARELEDRRKEADELRTTVSNQQSAIEVQGKEIKELEKKLQRNTEIHEENELIAEKNQDNNAKALSELQLENKQLAAECVRLEKDRHHLSREKDNLQTTVDQLEAACNSQATELSKARDLFQQREGVVSQFQTAITLGAGQVNALREQEETQIQELERLRTRLDEAEQEKIKLAHELAITSAELKMKQKRLDSFWEAAVTIVKKWDEPRESQPSVSEVQQQSGQQSERQRNLQYPAVSSEPPGELPGQQNPGQQTRIQQQTPLQHPLMQGSQLQFPMQQQSYSTQQQQAGWRQSQANEQQFTWGLRPPSLGHMALPLSNAGINGPQPAVPLLSSYIGGHAVSGFGQYPRPATFIDGPYRGPAGPGSGSSPANSPSSGPSPGTSPGRRPSGTRIPLPTGPTRSIRRSNESTFSIVSMGGSPDSQTPPTAIRADEQSQGKGNAAQSDSASQAGPRKRVTKRKRSVGQGAQPPPIAPKAAAGPATREDDPHTLVSGTPVRDEIVVEAARPTNIQS